MEEWMGKGWVGGWRVRRIDRWTDRWEGGCLVRWMGEWVYGQMEGRIDGQTGGWMGGYGCVNVIWMDGKMSRWILGGWVNE